MTGGVLALPVASLPGHAPQAAQAAVLEGEVVFEYDPTPLNTADGTTQLYLRHSNGSTVDLSNDPDWNYSSPAVSPDGKKIAYTSYKPNGFSALWVMNSDGSGKVQLTNPHGTSPYSTTYLWSDGQPTWSADGQEIAFQRLVDADSRTRIMKVAVGGGSPTTLASHGTDSYYAPAWSPDGTKIAFWSSGDASIHVMDDDGANQDRISEDPSPDGDSDPAWSPDGDTIFFRAAGAYGSSWIGRMDASDGSNRDNVTDINVSNQDYGPTVSPDGTKVVFGSNRDAQDVWMMNADGSGSVTNLTSGSYPEYSVNPAYVPADYPASAPSVSYVTLGDSVAAGEGTYYNWTWNGTGWETPGPSSPTWEYSQISGQDCHVSKQGHPYLLAFEMNWELTDFACTGAEAPNGVMNKQDFGGHDAGYPQLGKDNSGYDDANPYYDNAEPDYVSLSLGANDVEFANWVKLCYASGIVTGDCGGTTDEGLFAAMRADFENDLYAVLDEIHARSPDATVILTTYPNPFPDPYINCKDTGSLLLEEIDVGLSEEEVEWLIEKLGQLNNTISTVGQESPYSGFVEVVDLSDAWGLSSAHRLCGTDPWSYGPSIEVSDPGSPAPFHPTPRGQQRIAELIADAIS